MAVLNSYTIAIRWLRRSVLTLLIISFVGIINNTSAASQADAPDNIIIKESTYNKNPKHLMLYLKDTETLCALNGTPIKGGPLDTSYLLKKVSTSKTTYLSGRTKVVYVEGFSNSLGDNKSNCDLTLKPTRSVSFSSPTKNWTATIDKQGKHNLKIFDKTKGASPNINIAAFETKAYQNRINNFKNKKGKWRNRKYNLLEKRFGYLCGYQQTTSSQYDPCKLIESPYHVGTNHPLILNWLDQRTNTINRGATIIDCSQSPEAIKEKEGIGAVGDCHVIGNVKKIERFEINAAMPSGIFEIPDFAKKLKPEYTQEAKTDDSGE